MRVADYIAQEIVKKGVKDVFLLSGGGMMYLLDGLGLNKDITIHCHNHEQDAGIAAEGYARIAGGLGFCFATGGPGGLNAVEAIAECWQDSVPVVFIIGQSEVKQTTRNANIPNLRLFGAAEIDIIPIVESITKASFFVNQAGSIPYIFHAACMKALEGRPGPVVINIPLDIQRADINVEPAVMNPLPPRRIINSAQVQEVIHMWAAAKAPIILAGQGIRIAGAMEQFKIIMEQFNASVVTTQAGKDLMSYDNSHFIGHVGVKGDRAGNWAIQNSDFILCIGTSLHVFNTGYNIEDFGRNAKIVYVDPDESQLQKCTVRTELKIHSGIKAFLNALEDWKSWGARFNPFSIDTVTLRQYYDVMKESHKQEEGRLNVYKAIDIINKHSSEGDIIVSDSGSSFYTIGQAWKLKEKQRFISSNALGTMGVAIPMATGAYIASGKRVICFTGDGSLMTSLTELPVIDRENANIVICIFDNDGYSCIRNTQNSFFEGRHVATDSSNGVSTMDYCAVARKIGFRVMYAKDEITLKNAITECFAYRGPSLINIKTNIKQELIPNVLSTVDANGVFVPATLDNAYPYKEKK
jgi:acetolactate synthase-1/2/3 large subunit